MNRRHLLLAGLGASATASVSESASASSQRRTRRRGDTGFLWGSAGAAYQIEGGNVASDLWVMEHVKPTLFREPSGDAVDSYNRVGEDIALAASLGFNAHRFSIEWSRIEPEQGQISLAAIAYYRRVLETIRAHGMTPVVTLQAFHLAALVRCGGRLRKSRGRRALRPLCRTDHPTSWRPVRRGGDVQRAEPGRAFELGSVIPTDPAAGAGVACGGGAGGELRQVRAVGHGRLPHPDVDHHRGARARL